MPGADAHHAGRGRSAGARPRRARSRRGPRHGQRRRRRSGGGVPGGRRRLPGQPGRVRRGGGVRRASAGWPATPAAGRRPSCCRRGGSALRRSSCFRRPRAGLVTSRTSALPSPTSRSSPPAASRSIRSPSTSAPARWRWGSGARSSATRWTAARSARCASGRSLPSRRSGPGVNGRERRPCHPRRDDGARRPEPSRLATQRGGDDLRHGRLGVQRGDRRAATGDAGDVDRPRGRRPSGSPHPARVARRAGEGDHRHRSGADRSDDALAPERSPRRGSPTTGARAPARISRWPTSRRP